MLLPQWGYLLKTNTFRMVILLLKYYLKKRYTSNKQLRTVDYIGLVAKRFLSYLQQIQYILFTACKRS